MNEQVEEGLERLERIEEDLEEIKERTPNKRKSFIYGVWYGAGALIGGILALALLGYILSIFGVIPGLGEIARYLQDIVDRFHR